MLMLMIFILQTHGWENHHSPRECWRAHQTRLTLRADPHVPLPRSRVAATEGERDAAVAAVKQLSDKTDSLEEQLDKLARLLEEARERLDEKAQQLEHAEVRTSAVQQQQQQHVCMYRIHAVMCIYVYYQARLQLRLPPTAPVFLGGWLAVWLGVGLVVPSLYLLLVSWCGARHLVALFCRCCTSFQA